MKKFFYSFVAILLTLTTVAQDTTCKGKAAFQYAISGNTVNFYSSTTVNSSLYHYWKFGDGLTGDAANPMHIYVSAGSYRVVHYIKDTIRNCYDSAVKEFSITKNICDSLLAKFEWRRDSANSTKIFFINQSIPNSASAALVYKWTFGDGTSSTNKNPDHIYSSFGTYNVCLTISYLLNNSQTAVCTKTYCSVVNVVTPCTIQPKFAWAVDSSNLLNVRFTNQSDLSFTNAKFQWIFGDGSESTDINPIHKYSKAGVYQICLWQTVADTCIRSICKEITVRDCNMPADFTWTPDSAKINSLRFYPLPIQTIAPLSIKWSFGDGTYSTEYSPLHQYLQPGTYKVCVRIEYFAGCVKEVCKEVVVNVCNSTADFTYVLDSIYPMRGVKFNPLPGPLTVMPQNIKWSFGDGTTSIEYRPLHQYQLPGTYKVCLRIEFIAGCVKEVCKEVIVPAPADCQSVSKFAIERTSNDVNSYLFKAETSNSILKYIWTFGDGTGALGATATHKYLLAGKYNVCLTVYRGDNCASTTCKEITVGILNCDQTIVKFETQRVNPPLNNAVKFIAISSQSILTQNWTIGRNNATTPIKINSNNPTYIFQDTGTYKVCLHAITVNGCVKEFCDVIHITQVPDVCTLQVMPNPATASIQFKIQVEVAQPVIASIIDMTGIRKAVFYLNAVPGSNTYTLPIGTLPAGYYTLEVKVGNKLCNAKFQKVN